VAEKVDEKNPGDSNIVLEKQFLIPALDILWHHLLRRNPFRVRFL